MNSFTPTFNDSFPRPNNCNTFPYQSYSSSQGYCDQTFYRSGSPINFSIMNPDKAPADDITIGGGSKGNMTPLPLDFIPGSYDVLCGRGKKNYNSIGNQRLRRIVESYVEQYSAATSRQDKSDILSAIVNEVRNNSPTGGFIKQDPVSERWFEVGDFLAREKVSQAFRDALAFQYRSSKKFKHEKRRQRDKAAKRAKCKAGDATKDGAETTEKPKSKKSSPTLEGMPLLQKKQSLTVLREEPSMAPSVFVPVADPGRGNSQTDRPSRAMSMPMGNVPPASFLHQQGANRQAFGMVDQSQQQQMANPQIYSFNSHPGMPQHQDNSGRHTSWPHLFSSANPLFNPLHGGAGSGGQHHNMAAMSQRRFSDAMIPDANQSPFHQFHQSDLNSQAWSQEHDGGSSVNAALHASFPGTHRSNSSLAAGVMSAGSLGGGPSSGLSPVRLRQPAGRKGALMRSSSNVSSASATAIVAHLESSLSELDQDENPFEPVPLPAGPQGEQNEGATIGNKGKEDDEDSIRLDW